MSKIKTTPHKAEKKPPKIKLACHLCEKTMPSQQAMKRHFKDYHAAIKTLFICPACPTEYIRKNVCKWHMKKLHPECDKEPPVQRQFYSMKPSKDGKNIATSSIHIAAYGGIERTCPYMEQQNQYGAGLKTLD